MKLEITVSENIISDVFSNNPEYFKLHERISNHKIISSEELTEIWKKEAEDKGYLPIFMSWLFNKSRSRESFEKVNINNIESVDGTDNYNEKVLVSTAKESKDKIVVGVSKSTLINKNSDLKFVSKKQMSLQKKQEITISDLENVLKQSRIDSLFDIYETPITVKVSKNQDSSILAEYLSKFYKEESNITIKDAYLHDPKNEKNLNDYVLPYINKEVCKISLITYDKGSKQKFINYKGYDVNVSICKEEDNHNSYIETSKYRIILGYRLLTFGVNGKITKEERITIVRK